ncbi:dihydroneopterin aldolase [Clostridium sp. D33t1_170424_F3]|uniref:dihydroneopterin aldolase n=1 Tax=Clostridium sp. D33t1_170424_F3 TaxID=2787099 RepID=UPI0018AB5A45|nr:dihydroneopterin aldolase [Clostridium sp. D33t1_170424_F3]
MDKIIIKGLRVFAYHGVNPEEKRDGQPFELDITAHCDLRKAGRTDDLNDTVSYAKMAKTAARVMTEQSDDLLERAAQRVADAILEEYPPIQKVDVLLKKPEAPVKLEFAYMAVSITRMRGELHA